MKTANLWNLHVHVHAVANLNKTILPTFLKKRTLTAGRSVSYSTLPIIEKLPKRGTKYFFNSATHDTISILILKGLCHNF